MYVGCEGLSDLGNGPNKPTQTIIGEWSAKFHDGALVFTLVRVRISESDTKIWPAIWQHIIDVWHVPTLH